MTHEPRVSGEASASGYVQFWTAGESGFGHGPQSKALPSDGAGFGHTATGAVATKRDQQERGEAGEVAGVTGAALYAFAEASRALADGSSLHEALDRLVGAAARAT